MFDLLHDLVLTLQLPEPEYFCPLPGGGEALLAYPAEEAAVVPAGTDAPGWRLFPCDPADPAAVTEAVRAMARALGYMEGGPALVVETAPGAVAAADPQPQLTDQQRSAILHGSGPARILAGAGTGKTTVIVGRFHELVRQGVAPDRILALTFSREAARAMRDAVLPGLTAAPRLWISTFHSFCLKLLEGQPGLRLVSELERRAMLAALCDGPDWHHYVGGRQPQLVDDALTFIGHAKDYLLTPADVARYAAHRSDDRLADLARAYELFQAELARREAAEFSDFISKAVALLESDPAAAAAWQGRFDHILVDEFQDTNLAQFRVLQILAQGHGNLVVVGDDDQAIYRFRGASERYLVRLAGFYPNAVTYKVEENFRCPAAVLEVANRLIQANGAGREAKRLFTRTKVDGYPAVQHWEAQTEREEAEAVAAEIAERIRRGARADEFAILCRSLRRLGGDFARALARRGVPYRMVGDEGLHPVTAQTLALLRLTRAVTAPDLLMILAGRTPPAELYAALQEGDIALRFSRGEVAADLAGWLAQHRERPLPELVYEALKYLGHLRLAMTLTPADLDRLAAARDLQERAAAAADLDGLLAEYQSGAVRSHHVPGEAVTLMTVHAAKGLEFPVVFVTGLAEGLFPVQVDQAPVFYTAEAIRDWVDEPALGGAVPDAAERLRQHMREERRLAYVALTRAKRELILTRAKQYGQDTAEPSRFLAEMEAPPAEGVAGRLSDPVPDARAYLLRVAGGADTPVPDRVTEAVRLLAAAPGAVPLRRQAPPAPFAGTESLRLSATALEAYRECPRRYYYAQVLRLPDEDSIALAFGEAVHDALERYHKAVQAGGRPTWDELAAWWLASLDRSRCETEGQYQQLLERGRVFLRRYHGWADGRWKRIISTEDRFDVTYTDGAGRNHRLVGRYDLIAEGHDGTVEIIDFKTGHRKGATTVNKRPTKGSANNPDRKLQLGMYYLAHFGGEIDPRARVTYIFLRHVDDKYPAAFVDEFNAGGEQVIGCAHTAESLALIRATTDEIIEGILANRFERTTDENKCFYCPFREVCEVTPLDWF